MARHHKHKKSVVPTTRPFTTPSKVHSKPRRVPEASHSVITFLDEEKKLREKLMNGEDDEGLEEAHERIKDLLVTHKTSCLYRQKLLKNVYQDVEGSDDDRLSESSDDGDADPDFLLLNRDKAFKEFSDQAHEAHARAESIVTTMTHLLGGSINTMKAEQMKSGELRSNLEGAMKQASELSETLKTTVKKLATTKQQLDDMRFKADKLQEKADYAHQIRKETEFRLTKQEAQVGELEQKIVEMMSENKHKAQRIAQLEAKNKQLEQRAQKAELHVDSLVEIAVTKVREECDKKMQETALKVKEKLDKKNDEIESLHREIRDYKERIQELQKTIDLQQRQTSEATEALARADRLAKVISSSRADAERYKKRMLGIHDKLVEMEEVRDERDVLKQNYENTRSALAILQKHFEELQDKVALYEKEWKSREAEHARVMTVAQQRCEKASTTVQDLTLALSDSKAELAKAREAVDALRERQRIEVMNLIETLKQNTDRAAAPAEIAHELQSVRAIHYSTAETLRNASNRVVTHGELLQSGSAILSKLLHERRLYEQEGEERRKKRREQKEKERIERAHKREIRRNQLLEEYKKQIESLRKAASLSSLHAGAVAAAAVNSSQSVTPVLHDELSCDRPEAHPPVLSSSPPQNPGCDGSATDVASAMNVVGGGRTLAVDAIAKAVSHTLQAPIRQVYGILNRVRVGKPPLDPDRDGHHDVSEHTQNVATLRSELATQSLRRKELENAVAMLQAELAEKGAKPGEEDIGKETASEETPRLDIGAADDREEAHALLSTRISALRMQAAEESVEAARLQEKKLRKRIAGLQCALKKIQGEDNDVSVSDGLFESDSEWDSSSDEGTVLKEGLQETTDVPPVSKLIGESLEPTDENRLEGCQVKELAPEVTRCTQPVDGKPEGKRDIQLPRMGKRKAQLKALMLSLEEAKDREGRLVRMISDLQAEIRKLTDSNHVVRTLEEEKKQLSSEIARNARQHLEAIERLQDMLKRERQMRVQAQSILESRPSSPQEPSISDTVPKEMFADRVKKLRAATKQIGILEKAIEEAGTEALAKEREMVEKLQQACSERGELEGQLAAEKEKHDALEKSLKDEIESLHRHVRRLESAPHDFHPETLRTRGELLFALEREAALSKRYEKLKGRFADVESELYKLRDSYKRCDSERHRLSKQYSHEIEVTTSLRKLVDVAQSDDTVKHAQQAVIDLLQQEREKRERIEMRLKTFVRTVRSRSQALPPKTDMLSTVPEDKIVAPKPEAELPNVPNKVTPSDTLQETDAETTLSAHQLEGEKEDGKEVATIEASMIHHPRNDEDVEHTGKSEKPKVNMSDDENTEPSVAKEGDSEGDDDENDLLTDGLTPEYVLDALENAFADGQGMATMTGSIHNLCRKRLAIIVKEKAELQLVYNQEVEHRELLEQRVRQEVETNEHLRKKLSEHRADPEVLLESGTQTELKTSEAAVITEETQELPQRGYRTESPISPHAGPARETDFDASSTSVSDNCGDRDPESIISDQDVGVAERENPTYTRRRNRQEKQKMRQQARAKSVSHEGMGSNRADSMLLGTAGHQNPLRPQKNRGGSEQMVRDRATHLHRTAFSQPTTPTIETGSSDELDSDKEVDLSMFSSPMIQRDRARSATGHSKALPTNEKHKHRQAAIARSSRLVGDIALPKPNKSVSKGTFERPVTPTNANVSEQATQTFVAGVFCRAFLPCLHDTILNICTNSHQETDNATLTGSYVLPGTNDTNNAGNFDAMVESNLEPPFVINIKHKMNICDGARRSSIPSPVGVARCSLLPLSVRTSAFCLSPVTGIDIPTRNRLTSNEDASNLSALSVEKFPRTDYVVGKFREQRERQVSSAPASPTGLRSIGDRHVLTDWMLPSLRRISGSHIPPQPVIKTVAVGNQTDRDSVAVVDAGVGDSVAVPVPEQTDERSIVHPCPRPEVVDKPTQTSTNDDESTRGDAICAEEAATPEPSASMPEAPTISSRNSHEQCVSRCCDCNCHTNTPADLKLPMSQPSIELGTADASVATSPDMFLSCVSNHTENAELQTEVPSVHATQGYPAEPTEPTVTGTEGNPSEPASTDGLSEPGTTMPAAKPDSQRLVMSRDDADLISIFGSKADMVVKDASTTDLNIRLNTLRKENEDLKGSVGYYKKTIGELRDLLEDKGVRVDLETGTNKRVAMLTGKAAGNDPPMGVRYYFMPCMATADVKMAKKEVEDWLVEERRLCRDGALFNWCVLLHLARIRIISDRLLEAGTVHPALKRARAISSVVGKLNMIVRSKETRQISKSTGGVVDVEPVAEEDRLTFSQLSSTAFLRSKRDGARYLRRYNTVETLKALVKLTNIANQDLTAKRATPKVTVRDVVSNDLFPSKTLMPALTNALKEEDEIVSPATLNLQPSVDEGFGTGDDNSSPFHAPGGALAAGLGNLYGTIGSAGPIGIGIGHHLSNTQMHRINEILAWFPENFQDLSRMEQRQALAESVEYIMHGSEELEKRRAAKGLAKDDMLSHCPVPASIVRLRHILRHSSRQRRQALQYRSTHTVPDFTSHSSGVGSTMCAPEDTQGSLGRFPNRFVKTVHSHLTQANGTLESKHAPPPHHFRESASQPQPLRQVPKAAWESSPPLGQAMPIKQSLQMSQMANSLHNSTTFATVPRPPMTAPPGTSNRSAHLVIPKVGRTAVKPLLGRTSGFESSYDKDKENSGCKTERAVDSKFPSLPARGRSLTARD